MACYEHVPCRLNDVREIIFDANHNNYHPQISDDAIHERALKVNHVYHEISKTRYEKCSIGTFNDYYNVAKQRRNVKWDKILTTASKDLFVMDRSLRINRRDCEAHIRLNNKEWATLRKNAQYTHRDIYTEVMVETLRNLFKIRRHKRIAISVKDWDGFVSRAGTFMSWRTTLDKQIASHLWKEPSLVIEDLEEKINPHESDDEEEDEKTGERDYDYEVDDDDDDDENENQRYEHEDYYDSNDKYGNGYNRGHDDYDYYRHRSPLKGNEVNVAGGTHRQVVKVMKSGGDVLTLISVSQTEAERLKPNEETSFPSSYDYSVKKSLTISMPDYEHKIIGSGGERYVVYNIYMAGRQLCSRRYSEFHNLNETLKKEFHGFTFPKLPRKWPFALNEQQLNSRRRLLEQYLEKVCAVRVMAERDIIQEFSTDDDQATDSKKAETCRPVLSTQISGTTWCWTSDRRVLFYNPSNKQSVWEKPPELVGCPDVDDVLKAFLEKAAALKRSQGSTTDSSVSPTKGSVSTNISSTISTPTTTTSVNSSSEPQAPGTGALEDLEQPPTKKLKSEGSSGGVEKRGNQIEISLSHSKKESGGGTKPEVIEFLDDDESGKSHEVTALEAEACAAVLRATVTLETCLKQFRQMLYEADISAFSTWEKERHKIVFDKRYLLLTSNEREKVFDRYVEEIGEEEKRDRIERLKNVKLTLFAFLKEINLSSKANYSDFYSKYGREERFECVEKSRDREQFFHGYIYDLKKKEKEERTVKKKQERLDYLELLTDKIKDYHMSWSETKKKLESDSRYHIIDSEDREDIFREFLKQLRHKQRNSEKQKRKEKASSSDKKDEKSRKSSDGEKENAFQLEKDGVKPHNSKSLAISREGASRAIRTFSNITPSFTTEGGFVPAVLPLQDVTNKINSLISITAAGGDSIVARKELMLTI